MPTVPRKKNKSRGAAKGASFEREISVKLSLWVSQMKLKDVFWRSAMSGGRSTVLAKGGDGSASAHAGDLVANRPEGYALTSTFFVECKAYSKFSMEDIFIHGSRGLREIIVEKPIREANQWDLIPLIIIKPDRKKIMVMTDEMGVDLFSYGTHFPQDLCKARAHFPECDLTVYAFSDVVVGLDWEPIEREIRRRQRKAKGKRSAPTV